MSTRKLCEPCAKDTAVYGRCGRLARINRPGTICDRCLRDGRLLVSYLVCCEPEQRFGHTDECKATRKKATDPMLQRFASALFCTDERVLTLIGNAYGDGVWTTKAGQEEAICLALAKNGRVERLGRAWDLAADGHEPEASYRKEAEERAFAMRRFDRELVEYGQETKRLTRESNLKRSQAAYARRVGAPLPREEHDANVRMLQAVERDRTQARLVEEAAQKRIDDERKRQERAERKAEHPQCGAPSPIGSAEPQGVFEHERCTRQKHDYGDHQYRVNGRIISGWNAQSYYVGEDGARATSQALRSAEPVLNEHGCIGYVVKPGIRPPRQGDSRLSPAFGTNCHGQRCGFCGECLLDGVPRAQ